MKNSIFLSIAAGALLLSACSESLETVSDVAQQAQDNRIQVALGVRQMDVVTRSNALGTEGTMTVTAKSFSGREPTEDNPFYPMVWFSDDETKGNYTLTDDAHRNKVKFTSTTLTFPDYDIEYNTADKSKKTWCFGLYPTNDGLWGVENTAGWEPTPLGTVLYADISGQEDLMYADQVAGSINDKFTSEIGGDNDNRLQFHHLLTWLKIRVNAAEQGAGTAWGKVKLLRVKTQRRVRIDLGTGQIYDKTSDEYWINAFVPDPDDAVNPQQYKDLEPDTPEDPMVASVLAVPATHYLLEYQTEEMSEAKTIDIPLYMLVDDGTGTLVSQPVTTPDEARNKVFVITLFFYQREKVEAQCTLEPMTDEVELVYGEQANPLTLTPPSESFSYTGSARTYSSAVTVQDGGTTLTAGTDYDLHYSNNINAGVGTVAAVGKGTYAGRVGTHAFNISKADGSGTIAFAEDDVSKAYGDDDFTNTLTPSLSGAGTISYHIAYTSDHPEIATVGSDGTVHIVSAAPATPVTITATVQDGANHHYASTIQDTYTLTVERKLGELSYATTAVEKTYSTDPFTNPLTLTGDAIPIYTSSEPTVATVDGATGVVTLLKVGTTTISASVTGGIGINYRYSPALASYTLQVNKAPATISFAEPNITKRVGDFSFTPVVNNTGNNLALSFESSDPAVASVNASTGEVTIVGTGIAYITVATADTDQYDYDVTSATLTLTVTN